MSLGQAWFWTDSWQEGETQATRDIKGGRTEVFKDDQSFLDSLDGLSPGQGDHVTSETEQRTTDDARVPNGAHTHGPAGCYRGCPGYTRVIAEKTLARGGPNREESSMNIQDTLLAYSEWLDAQGLVASDLTPGADTRPHEQLAKDFIEQRDGQPLR